MAKRLNKNLVVVLTIAGMVLTTAAGVILVNSLPQKSPQVFVHEAEKALKDGEFGKAADYYQRAAKRATDAGDTVAANNYLIKAGDLALSAGDSTRAMGLWNHVVVADPSQMGAQEKIVTFTLELAELSNSSEWWGRLQTPAQKLVDAAEKAKSKSYVGHHALGRALLALSHVRDTNKEEGKKHLIEAVNGDKSNPEYARSLARYYLLEAAADKSPTPNPQYIKDAAALFDQAVAHASEDPEKRAKAYLYRGQFYSTAGAATVFPDADARALADLEEANRLAPKNEEAVIGLGVFWHGKKQNAVKTGAPPAQIEEYREKARQLYARAIDVDPDHYLGYLQLAGLYLEEKRYDDAIVVLDGRLKRPINREHYLKWRNRQYMLTVRETAFKTYMAKYSEVLQGATSQEAAKTATAPVLARLKNIYDETRAENGEDDPYVLFMQGRLLFLQDEAHAAVKALKKAEELTPGETPEIQRVLAILYSQIGSTGAAETALNFYLSASPNDETALILQARIKNQLGQPEQALIAADRVLAMNPGNKEALRTKMQAHLQLKNYQAVEVIREQLNEGGSTGQDALVRALLRRQEALTSDPPDQAKLVQAVDMLQKILATEPLNYSALLHLVTILSRELNPRQAPEALKRVADFRAGIEKQLAEVAQTQPSGTVAENFTRQLINLDLMAITIDDSIAAEDKVKRKEEIIRREKDPFTVALSLFQLYRAEPAGLEAAFLHLKDAYRLKPEEPVVLEAMLQMSIDHKDWKLAEEVADKAVASGVEKSGGHMYRGLIWLSRTENPGNLVEAEKEFRAALIEVPDFADAYAHLGRALLGQNRIDDARVAFQRAMQLNPRNLYAPVGLAIIADAEGKEDEKQKYLAIASTVAPGNAWVGREIQNQQDQRDPKKGISRREEMRKSNPKDLDNLVRLAELYTYDKRFDEADKAFQAAMEVAPTNLRLAGIYARFLAGKQPPDIAGARVMLKKVVEAIDPKTPDVKATAQILYASFLRGINRQDKEAPPLEEIDAAFLAASQISATMGIQSEIAAYFLETGRVADAMKWYQESRASAQRAGNKAQVRTAHQLIVQTLLQTANPDNFEETRKEIADYRQLYPEDGVGNMMQAELDIASGHEPQAVKQLSEFIARMPQNPLGYLKRGAAYFRRSEWDAAIKDLREAKQLDPQFMNGAPRLLLAQALEQNRQPDAAVSELQSLTEDMPEQGTAAQQLFSLYVRLKRYDSAESLINARSQRTGNPAFWTNLRRAIAMERKDYAAAAAHALATVEQAQYAPAAIDSYLLLLLELNRFDELIAYVDQRLPAEHRKDAVLIRQASAYLGKGDVPKAVELYFKAVSTPPVDVVLLSDFFNRDPQVKKHHDALQRHLESVWQTDPNGRNVRLVLSSVYRSGGNSAKAAEALGAVLQAATDDTLQKAEEKVIFTRSLATLHYEAKQWEKARDLYKEVLAKSPNDAVSLNNLAYLLMDQLSAAEEALTYSQRVNQVIPEGAAQKSSVLDTLGWNLFLLGRYDEAISRLGRSLELDTRAGSVHYHLAEALYARSRKASSDVAVMDLEQAKKEVKTAHDLLVEAGSDPEHVADRVQALASKLGVQLTTSVPTTQAAS